MNLLPKSHKEFSEKDYWNRFFKKRGNKAFEWYGEYLELCTHLHKYIKPKDSVLIPGCGNSGLSADLYDVGLTNLTNIDVSEVAIRQMNAANAHRNLMKFINMDATDMSFENESFNVVLDKGTLDALMPDDSKEPNELIDKYFAEIKRVLKLGGRFLCISLLQSHILRKLIAGFCEDKSWMFRVVRCHEAEEKNAANGDGMTLPVFVVVATKFKEMPKLILEACLAGEKMVRLDSTDQLVECVKSAQDTAFITNGLARSSIEDHAEVSLDLMEPGGDGTPRYTMYVVDQNTSQAVNKYGVFIVPQGRESEWLFGTPSGRRQLQCSAKCSRLVVAILRRGHQFTSLEAVKEELAHAAKMLLPHGFVGQIPFLSLGADVGTRTVVHAGTSAVSGPYVVEDVRVDDVTFRRLVFLGNQMLVQSEAKIKHVKKKNKTRLVVDFGHISSYHSFMCVGVVLPCSAESHGVAVLGLGGGGLCMFLRKCFDDVSITAVDIDPSMLSVARDHFQLQTDDRLKVLVQDGADFIKEQADKGVKYAAVLLDMDSKDSSVGLSCPPPQFITSDALDQIKRILTDDGVKYAAVLLDMDSKDSSVGLSCPPPQFITSDALDQIKRILTDDGQLVLNLVCRDNTLRDEIVSKLVRHFKQICSIKLDEDLNEIIFCTNSEKEYASCLDEAVKWLNMTARQKGLVKVRCVDLKDFMQNVHIIG